MNKKVFQKWTDEEIELLKANSQNDYDILQSLFPHRSLKSIKHKINNMNLPRKVFYERYTEAEDEILKNNTNLPVSEVRKLLPNRTVESILQRYRILGLEWTKTWEFWTDEEIKIIETYDTIDEMSKHLSNRDGYSIYLKARKMGKYFNDYWTDEELSILEQNYGTKQVFEFKHLLPNRNESSIYSKANTLCLKGLMGKYNIKDEEIINLFNEGKYCAEIARMLNITLNTVIIRLKRNNIQYEKKIFYGEDVHSWKGGITPENRKIRGSIEFKNWRLSVFERDNYTCQCCGDDKGGNLAAHHIENFSEYEDKRFDINNGITLCNDCHNPSIEGSFHYIYGTRNNNLEQLEEYISNYKLKHLFLLQEM